MDNPEVAVMHEWPEVARWVASKLADHALAELESDHLDDLGVPSAVFRDLRACTEMFYTGVQSVDVANSNRKFLLVVPLECTESLVAHVEGSREALMQRMTDEPPTIYLQALELALGRESVEEYRFPLLWEVGDLDTERFAIYVRQFRTSEDIANGWEFTSGIYFESFPATGRK
jgi:hypothetical protein